MWPMLFGTLSQITNFQGALGATAHAQHLQVGNLVGKGNQFVSVVKLGVAGNLGQTSPDTLAAENVQQHMFRLFFSKMIDKHVVAGLVEFGQDRARRKLHKHLVGAVHVKVRNGGCPQQLFEIGDGLDDRLWDDGPVLFKRQIRHLIVGIVDANLPAIVPAGAVASNADIGAFHIRLQVDGMC